MCMLLRYEITEETWILRLYTYICREAHTQKIIYTYNIQYASTRTYISDKQESRVSEKSDSVSENIFLNIIIQTTTYRFKDIMIPCYGRLVAIISNRRLMSINSDCYKIIYCIFFDHRIRELCHFCCCNGREAGEQSVKRNGEVKSALSRVLSNLARIA